jgi:chromosome segregation protein SMC
MRLKSIEITGFKSFPDKIELEFPKGITCVVGPNGSGKSNISDAIRWVMGEQSVKMLRGGKMEDVIFSGTQKRKPLGFCEVGILVDNADKTLPIDFDEILVTRRLFRSGESEYYINKSGCRLKDIQELFMDTGLGKDGYSLVGQGRIDGIINGKPSERRTFFEEACGISKYRHRKDEAERKLANTNDNILRVEDIIIELESQLGPLKLQSEKAKKYLVYRDELKVLEVNVWLDTIEKHRSSLRDLNENFQNCKKELETAKADLEKTDSRIETLLAESKNLQEDTDQLSQQYHTEEYNTKTYENQIEIFKNNIMHNNENIRRMEREKHEMEKKIGSFHTYIEEISRKIEEIERNREEKQKAIEGLQAEFSKLADSIATHNSFIDSLKGKLTEQNNTVSTLNAKKAACESLMDNLESRRRAIEEEMREKQASVKGLEAEIANYQKELNQLEAEEARMSGEIERLLRKEKEAEQRFEESSAAFQKARSDYMADKNRLGMLRDMENDFSGYPRSVKDVLTAHKNGELSGLSVFGTVASVIETRKEYALAIDAALAAATQFVIVGEEKDAKYAIQYLKKTKSGKATFLPIRTVKSQKPLNGDIRKEKGFVGIASELVDFEHQFAGIIENLLIRVAVFDNMDNAIMAARHFQHSFKIVTLTGEVLNAGGSITGGGFKNNTGAISRNAELNELAEKMKAWRTRLDKAERELSEKKNEIAFAREEAEQEKQKKQQVNTQKIDILSKIRLNGQLIETRKKDSSVLEEERRELSVKLGQNEGNLQSFADQMASLQQSISELEEKILHNNQDYEKIIRAKEEYNGRIADEKMALGYLEKDLSTEKDKLISLNNEIGGQNDALSAKEAEIEEAKAKNEDLQDEIDFKYQQISQLKDNITEYQKKMEQNKQRKAECEEALLKSQNGSKELRDKLIALQEEYSRLESRTTKAETELEYIINNLWDSYELTVTTATELKKDIGSISAANKSINELKNKIKDLGNINIDAIEEYKNVSERYEFLTAQKDDLLEAKSNLEQIITEMLKLMKTIFGTQFEKISIAFNETFQELFGGGKADLRLSDPADILESGIEIEVQPPGKKLTNISLFSGGEKAFTAIALLFAILKVKPTPFCLFDEIEAALDDVNVYRYADYLKKYKEETQFIVISHRRGTMEAADTLYGVTMQEKGVSKLLSLDIDEVEEMTK